MTCYSISAYRKGKERKLNITEVKRAIPLSTNCRCSTVLNFYKTWYLICSKPSMLVHATPTRLAMASIKAYFAGFKGYNSLWLPTLLWTLWFNPFFSSKACFFYLPKFFITSIAAIWPDLYANHSFLTKPIRVKTSGKDWQESHWVGLKNESIYWWQYL